MENNKTLWTYKGKKAFNAIISFLLSHLDLIIFGTAMFFKSIVFNREIVLNHNNRSLIYGSIGAVLIFAGISFFLKRRGRVVLLIAFDAVASIIMISDMVYYRYFNDVISIPVIKQAVLMDSLQSSITKLFRWVDLLFVLDIIISAMVLFIFSTRFNFKKNQRLLVRMAGAVVIFLAGIGFTNLSFSGITKMTGKDIFKSVHDHTIFVQNVGILNFHGFDTYFYAEKAFAGNGDISEKEILEINSDLGEKNKDAGAKKLFGAGKGKNLIVIQVEALQNNMLGLQINGKEVTPNLNKFSKKSIYFNNYFCQTAQGGTSDAEFISNTSYFPLAQGSVYFSYPANNFESLPKALKDEGYKTLAMHAFRGSYWNRSTMYPGLGFDVFKNSSNYKKDDMIGWGLSDNSFLDQSLEMLKNEKQPFYSFIITLSSHFPYDAFKDSTEFDAGPFNNTFFGNYTKAVNYTDKALGNFFDKLDKSGLMDNSVVVLYGDHFAVQKNELEPLKDFLKLNPNNDIGYLEMLKVPLIIHLPGDKEAVTVDLPGGQLDMFPTVANILGISPKYALGKDILNSEKDFITFRDGGFTDGEMVYLRAYNKCFDMKSGQELETDKYKVQIGLSQKKLDMSDKVLENNLINYFNSLENE